LKIVKYLVVIMDGASGWPLPDRGNKTCLELASTPNLDIMAGSGYLGMSRTVPQGMEPGSAPACMSVLGYDPTVYYKGRSAIEARSVGVPINKGEVTFRCNLVTVIDRKMISHSAGHITTDEARDIMATLNNELGTYSMRFYTGINYRHIFKVGGREDTVKAICTPPHDITDKPVEQYLPNGEGSDLLLDLMERSQSVLENHPVNITRKKNGKLPATGIWLFWPSGEVPEMPPFQKAFGLKAALTSGVDLLRGLGLMAGFDILNIEGVTDGLDNDFAAQAEGALKSLSDHDLAVMHIEAPDEMGHRGSVDDKIRSIELIDRDVMGRLLTWKGGSLKVLVMPDHPTPIKLKTHCDEPVPYMIWGAGTNGNGCRRYTEEEARKTVVLIDPGYKLMAMFAGMNNK
jgi:2,3-bisphosphoglycerate-independent phosphoglycerate mutase